VSDGLPPTAELVDEVRARLAGGRGAFEDEVFAVTAVLWRRQVFVGYDLVAERLAALPGPAGRLTALFDDLRADGATQPGLALFPLHGIRIAAPLADGDAGPVQYVRPEAGVALTSQTGQIDQTVAFLEQARVAFGARKPVDAARVEHLDRLGTLRWLTTNPLLAVRLVSQRGTSRDTEPAVATCVQAARAQLAMIACFHPAVRSIDDAAIVFPFPTRDLGHYVIFSDVVGRPDALVADRVATGGRPAVAELSELPIAFDPAHLGDPALLGRIDRAIAVARGGRVVDLVPGDARGHDARTRAAIRLFETLDPFLTSFRGARPNREATIALATAFETLLTDRYARDVTRRLKRRLALVLDGADGAEELAAAFAGLYRARGAAVHGDAEHEAADLLLARRAFVHAFCTLTERVAGLPLDTLTPMQALTGDAAA
jgi:hypothetical protein